MKMALFFLNMGVSLTVVLHSTVIAQGNGEQLVSRQNESVVKEGIFFMPHTDVVPYDVSLMSKLPKIHDAVNFDEHSVVFSIVIPFYLKRIFVPELLPSYDFVKEHALFYSIPGTELSNDNAKSPWTDGYDVIYLPYKIKQWVILVAITSGDYYGATYVFIKQVDDTINPASILKEIFLPDVYDIVCFENLPSEDNAYSKSIIPMYTHGQVLCAKRLNVFFTEEVPKSRIFLMSDLFSSIEGGDVDKQKQLQTTRLTEIREEQCKTLISTPEGRVALLGMLLSDEGKAEFGADTYRYNQYRNLPFDTLFQYYFYLKHDDDRDNFGSIYQPVWRNEITTPAESEAIGKLLRSKEMKVKEYGIRLMGAARARSLLPDLLALCLEEEQIYNAQTIYFFPIDAPNESHIIPHTYNFRIYRLLGKFGDRESLKALIEMQKDSTLSLEVQADVQLAIDEIKRNLAEQERREADPDYNNPPPVRVTVPEAAERVPHPLPETSSRWKTVLLVNGIIVAVMLALYFYLRWRRQM